MADPTDCSTSKGKLANQVQNMNHSNISIVFPFHMCKVSQRIRCCLSRGGVNSWFMNQFSVRAAVAEDDSSKVSSPQEHPKNTVKPISIVSSELEMLARAYIQQETGMERVKMIFKKE